MYCMREKDIEGECEVLIEKGKWTMWRNGKRLSLPLLTNTANTTNMTNSRVTLTPEASIGQSFRE